MNPSLPAVRSLLDSTALVRKQVERLNRITGAEYNLFSVLRLSTHENSHSLILADLLNPSGTHGQGDIFLEAFKLEVGQIVETRGSAKLGDSLSKLITNNLQVFTELHLGQKTEISGGRIDIALQAGQIKILIENKIYATLQERQLERYLYTGNPVIFLTLNETDFDDRSLPKERNLFKVSYQFHISSWLKRCIELTSTKPPIRESISQYLQIIQKLTGQGGSNLMTEQLREIITRDQESLRAFFELRQCESDILNAVGERLFEIGGLVASKSGLKLLGNSFKYSYAYQGLMFSCESWKESKLQVGIQFHRNYCGLFFGVAYIEERKTDQRSDLALSINANFAEEIGGDSGQPNQWWPAHQYFEGDLKDWSAEQFWQILSCSPTEDNLGTFGELLLEKVNLMTKVVNNAIKNHQ